MALWVDAEVCVAGPDAVQAELVFLDVKVELQIIVLSAKTPRKQQERIGLGRRTFLKLPFVPRTQNLNCSTSGLTTPAFTVTTIGPGYLNNTVCESGAVPSTFTPRLCVPTNPVTFSGIPKR